MVKTSCQIQNCDSFIYLPNRNKLYQNFGGLFSFLCRILCKVIWLMRNTINVIPESSFENFLELIIKNYIVKYLYFLQKNREFGKDTDYPELPWLKFISIFCSYNDPLSVVIQTKPMLTPFFLGHIVFFFIGWHYKILDFVSLSTYWIMIAYWHCVSKGRTSIIIFD